MLGRFVLLSLITTLLSGLIFLVTQQSLRLSANDPQIQMAEDTASQLSTQKDTFQITSLPRVDIGKSLSPFEIIYDADGTIISSSGQLNGKVPALPKGVFAYAKEHPDDRFTWQPQDGVRIAAVVKHFSGRTDGYVLAGRSLREVENRVEKLQTDVMLGWAVTEAVIFFTILITSFRHKKKK